VSGIAVGVILIVLAACGGLALLWDSRRKS